MTKRTERDGVGQFHRKINSFETGRFEVSREFDSKLVHARDLTSSGLKTEAVVISEKMRSLREMWIRER